MRRLTFVAVGAALWLASPPGRAHISLEAPVSRYYQTSARQADQTKQKSGPCGNSNDSRTANASLITRFRPGETIVVSWRETVQHPGHFRIAFDNDGQDFSLPGEESPAGVVILADDIADKSGSNGVSYSQEVTLPEIECDRCTLQLIQVMTTAEPPYRASDLYFNCADLILAASGGSSSTNSSLGGAGGVSARATTMGGAGGSGTRSNFAGGEGGTGTRVSAGGASGTLSVDGSGGQKSSTGGSVSSSIPTNATHQGGSGSSNATRTTRAQGSRPGSSSVTTESSAEGNEEHGPESQTGGATHFDGETSSGGAEEAVLPSSVTSGNTLGTDARSGCSFHVPDADHGRVLFAPSLWALAWLAWQTRTRFRWRARTDA